MFSLKKTYVFFGEPYSSTLQVLSISRHPGLNISPERPPVPVRLLIRLVQLFPEHNFTEPRQSLLLQYVKYIFRLFKIANQSQRSQSKQIKQIRDLFQIQNKYHYSICMHHVCMTYVVSSESETKSDLKTPTKSFGKNSDTKVFKPESALLGELLGTYSGAFQGKLCSCS